ncbi:MAG: recombination regulator RecX [Firmicutes bacterium]|nr:recombination regulator RecX [Bacillota bacterium]
MTITGLEPQKHRQGRVSVFIDGRFAFGMDEADALGFGLAENEEISKERLDHILREAVLAGAKNEALRLVALRARTEAEIRGRLSGDYPAGVVVRVVKFLKSYGYIDDRAYARDFLEYGRGGRHFGLARIRFELRRRGVADGVIDEAVSGLKADGDGETEAALAALESRLRGAEFPQGRKERNRLRGYLARKGFSGETIREVFERMGAEPDGEDGDEDEEVR